MRTRVRLGPLLWRLRRIIAIETGLPARRSLHVVKFTAELPARLKRGRMVIRKVTASFGAAAKPRESHETVDVYDVEGLCDAIEELVRRRKRSPPGRATHHRGAASDEL